MTGMWILLLRMNGLFIKYNLYAQKTFPPDSLFPAEEGIPLLRQCAFFYAAFPFCSSSVKKILTA